MQVPDAERTAEDSLAFKYSGGYWDARRRGQYEGCRDIFGPDPSGGGPPARSASGGLTRGGSLTPGQAPGPGSQ